MKLTFMPFWFVGFLRSLGELAMGVEGCPGGGGVELPEFPELPELVLAPEPGAANGLMRLTQASKVLTLWLAVALIVTLNSS